MARVPEKGVESARAELPRLLDEAERGRSTIITRRGRAVAAIVPASQAATPRQLSFTAFAGSGKGLWGRDAARRARTLRDEWSR
ncbi:MAG: type II toxin-antitoxin system Phd/YefM family antitoxin [Burkholderiales bacterium]|mgnify:CR=1 FL=1|nr:type II toxin-antitoxin system prevent-host-death family antitoxin [Burkholderiales bacterium]MBZ0248999.1 type II toxin-antitoxin system Phd/YefM family antitoxin [Burkholderiales bacterium]MCL4687355.1 type II toxin-antitoxin system prevent-host-death family antitoxin [Burkholderiales bacterium]